MVNRAWRGAAKAGNEPMMPQFCLHQPLLFSFPQLGCDARWEKLPARRHEQEPGSKDNGCHAARRAPFLLSLAIIGASVCLALGITLPIIKLTKYVFWTTEHSLLSTVQVADQGRPDLPRRHGARLLDRLAGREAALSAARLDAARSTRSCGSDRSCARSNGSANGRCTTCWCWR